MSRRRKQKSDQSNLEKIKLEMRRKKQKAEAVTGKDSIVQDSIMVAADTNVELVVFLVGGESFAFRLKQVREVVRVDQLRSIPNTPAHIIGLYSLRGNLVPVIDLRQCFNMPSAISADDGRMIVVEIDGEQVGMMTDRVTEIMRVPTSALIEPPSQFKPKDHGYLSEMVIKGNRMIMVLDAEKIANGSRMNGT
jgi:purine-binding chemotaxis protein CheW